MSAKRHALFGLSLAVALTTLVGPVLSEDNTTAKTGVLTANGSGNIMLHVEQGKVVVDSCKGDLWVSKSAKVEIDGTSGTKSSADLREAMQSGSGAAPRPPRGSADENASKPSSEAGYLYKGVAGKLTISGTSYIVRINGKVTTLKATGIGVAMLTGDGSYSVTKEGETSVTKGKWATLPERPERGGEMGPPPGGPGRSDRGAPPQMQMIKFGDAKDLQMPGRPAGR